MNVNDLFLVYRMWIGRISDKELAIRLSRVCKIIRDESDDKMHKRMCRSLIRLVSDGKYTEVLNSLKKAEPLK